MSSPKPEPLAGTPPPPDICTGNYFYQSFCFNEWRFGWPGQGGPPGLIDGQGCGNHARMWRDLLGRTLYIVGQGPGADRYPFPDQTVDPEGFDFFRALYQPATPSEKATQDSWVRQGYSSLLLGRLGGVQNPKLKPLSAVPDPQRTAWSNQFGCGGPVLPTYCPDDFITRGQMAAFIINTVNWMVDNPNQKMATTDVQQFSDVPASNQFFHQINALKLAGVTAGKSPCAKT